MNYGNMYNLFRVAQKRLEPSLLNLKVKIQ